MRKHPILVVGSVNMDLVCTAEHIPSPGETVAGTGFELFQGGKGANQAVGVARLGHPVSMVGCVGDDDFGARLRQGLRRDGVSTKWLKIARGVSSGVALIAVDSRGQNSIVVVAGANGRVLPADVERASPVLKSAGMILTQLEIPFETVECLARLAHRFNVPLMLDPAPARPLPPELLRAVTVLTPNETEASILCDGRPTGLDPSTAANLAGILRSRGARNVVIKMGEQGAFALGETDEGVFLPAFKVSVVDSTGAGDAFNAGLAVSLVKEMDLIASARVASAVGALSVTRKGAQASMPSSKEVKEFLSTQLVGGGSELTARPVVTVR